jgi:galactokinase
MNNELESAIYALYGPNSTSQITRYSAAMATFRAHFGHTDNIHIIRAPGRVNLIGEHTDYNHGYVMPAALDRDVVILARPRTDGMVHLHNMEAGFAPVLFPVAFDIPAAPAGDWGNYARGAFQVFARQMNGLPPGMDALVVSASPHGVPRGAGLSSSTAFTVAIATTLCTLAGWHLAAEEIIRLCSDSEWYVGTRGGIMDQFASLYGQRGHVLFLDCRPAAGGYYRYQALPLPEAYQLLVVDSGVHHENSRGEFNQRVAACRAGVGLLRRDYPQMTHLRDVQSIPWTVLEPLLPETVTARQLQNNGISLGELPGLDLDAPLRVRACCRHVWTENQRVIHAVDALESRDVVGLGQLLTAAHASARDDYAISCPELEILVASAQAVDGVYGTRLTGAGWGGCMIALVHQDAVQNFQHHVQASYTAQTGRNAAIFPCQAGSGAGAMGIFNA